MFYEVPLKEFEYCCMDYKWIVVWIINGLIRVRDYICVACW